MQNSGSYCSLDHFVWRCGFPESHAAGFCADRVCECGVDHRQITIRSRGRPAAEVRGCHPCVEPAIEIELHDPRPPARSSAGTRALLYFTPAVRSKIEQQRNCRSHCFLCHVPQASRDARKNGSSADYFRWPNNHTNQPGIVVERENGRRVCSPAAFYSHDPHPLEFRQPVRLQLTLQLIQACWFFRLIFQVSGRFRI